MLVVLTGALDVTVRYAVAVYFPQGHKVSADTWDFGLTTSSETLQLSVPPIEAALTPCLSDYRKCSDLWFLAGEVALFEQVVRLSLDLIFDIHHFLWTLSHLFFQNHPTGEVEIQKCDESAVVNFEVHKLEHVPFCLFIL